MSDNDQVTKIDRPLECVCVLCTNIHEARKAVNKVPVEYITDQNAADQVTSGAKLLQEAHASIHEAHNPLMYGPGVGQQRNVPTVPSSNIVADLTPSKRSPLKENKNAVDTSHTRQVTNPWVDAAPDGFSSAVKAKEELEVFYKAFFARATELGILRGQQVATQPSTALAIIPDKKSPIKEASKFIVCDHCRSHGLRCNEASACKECILRQVACTHRGCVISPESREACPRQVCFYVHKDWMPNVHGQHSPNDSCWIILPGKLRDYLSAGAVHKLPPKSEEEIADCYRNVSALQQHAAYQITDCVKRGEATFDNVLMACRCEKVEREEARTRVAEQGMGRLALGENKGI